MRFFVSILALAATAVGLTIEGIQGNERVDLSQSFVIQWMSVLTDDKNFTIYLVNMNSQPNVDKKIADNVQTPTGNYTVNGVSGSDLTPGYGYQFNFVSSNPSYTGILAQSPQFNVTKFAPVPTPTPSTTPTVSATVSATEVAKATAKTGGAASVVAPAAVGSLMMGLLALVM